VVKTHPGIPDRVPDAVGERRQLLGGQRALGVQEDEVVVAEGAGVTAADAADGRQGDSLDPAPPVALAQIPASHRRLKAARAARRAGPAPATAKSRVPARSSRLELSSLEGVVMLRSPRRRARRCGPGTTVLDRHDPDLAVTDAAGLGGLEDDVDHG
jgi:hypothetical protein